MGAALLALALAALTLAPAWDGAAAGALGCARTGSSPLRSKPASTLSLAPATADGQEGALSTPGLGGTENVGVAPPLTTARLVPLSLEEARSWGPEAGGGVRATVAGVRVTSRLDGAILAAIDRFASEPAAMADLPERLGGGFLFAVGTHIWRADTWLGRAMPIFTSPVAIGEILVGLDRVYVRYAQGSLAAFDPRTGGRLDLGSLPSAPHLGRLAATDAWHALAITDLRGVLVTADAGNSWQPAALSLDPSEAVARGDGVAVGGRDARGVLQWRLVRFDGQSEPVAAADEAPALGADTTARRDAIARIFGPRPLAAALEDGWPLTDGTALVARDGALARIRLSDGVLVEAVKNAFAMKPARCHPLALATERDRGAFGFVCGEPHGETRIYAWDRAGSRVAPLREFAQPRQVLAFGNGSLAVRGTCSRNLDAAPRADEQAWCIMASDRQWSEMRVRGENVDQARVVLLRDGRAAIVRPPSNADLSTARLTLVDGATQTDRRIHLPLLRADAVRALRFGVWMDGFDERRAGVLGGWIDAGGSVLGIELSLDGEARVGEYIRDAGAPVVAGVWGFGWTASRGGFETTDGGMTWAKEIALPEPIAEPHAGRERACGPLGCVMAGWLRIGWGAAHAPPPASMPAAHPAGLWAVRTELRLQCTPLGPERPRQAGALKSSPSGLRDRTAAGAVSAATWGSVPAFPPFSGVAGPAMPADDVGFAVDAFNGLEHTLRATALARVYAWGPGTGEWDSLGRWQIRWDSPWAGLAQTRSTSLSPAPWSTLDAARRGLGMGPAVPTAWAVLSGEDPDHALLVARHSREHPAAEVWSLESGRPPTFVRPEGGRSLPEVQSAARIGGRWVLATSQDSAETAATVVWRVDGDVAREVLRVPRAGFESGGRARLARRSDGRALGLAVEGQPDIARAPSIWVVGLDLDADGASEPAALAPPEMASGALALCAGGEPGWQIELPYSHSVRASVGDGALVTLRGVTARIRVAPHRACIEAIAGSVDAEGLAAADVFPIPAAPAGATFPGAHPGAAPATTTEIETSLFFAQARVALRCWQP